MNGKDITFDVNGQAVAGYVVMPEQASAPGVIVLHAWWGLKPFFKKFCDRLAGEGFAAFAPDLNNGKIAKTIDEAKQLMSERNQEQQQATVTAASDFLRARPGVRKEALAVIGFSMGAAWSLVLASERSVDVSKVVLFYGSYYGMDFAKVRADILGHYADHDEWEPLDDVRGMEKDMRAAGLKPTFHFYESTLHWFVEEDRPEYDPQAARLAWTRTLEFLRG
ncbi:MAG TPA: dienelactone hydrolase family protein [Anaerolineales bacterium]|nr:dienelactone hydrolase family protein [Anaerolineales bacterium]